MGQGQSNGRKTRRSGKGTYTQNVENINSNNENETVNGNQNETGNQNESVNMPLGMPSFDYMKRVSSAANIGGVFAFSFYFPEFYGDRSRAIENMNYSIYLKGISMYSKAISKENSVFMNWRILIYMDEYSYRVMDGVFKNPSDEVHHFSSLTNTNPYINTVKLFDRVYNPLTDPNTDIIIVKWPYYDIYAGGNVDGSVMRCMRFRAFFDYPHVPVFVRDADTLFASNNQIRIEADELYNWEKNFYEGTLQYPNTFFFGTSAAYIRFWHRNYRKDIKAPLGAFAGFQSSIPNVPCFQNEDLWRNALDYIGTHSYRVKKNGETVLYNEHVEINNEDGKGTVHVANGKDEQILIFIFVPACLDHIFFFDLDIHSYRPYKLGHNGIFNLNYPSNILEKGSNTNIRDIFKVFMNNYKNKNKVKTMISSLYNQEKTIRKEKENQLQAITNSIPNYKLMNSVSINKLNSIKYILKNKNTINSLKPLRNNYSTKFVNTIKTYRMLEKNVKKGKNTGPTLQKLKTAIHTQKNSGSAFIKKALELNPYLFSNLEGIQGKEALNTLKTLAQEGGNRTRKRRANH